MKPTMVGEGRATEVLRPDVADLPIALLETGAVVLSSEQQTSARTALAKVDFAEMQSGDVVKIGLDAEQNLQRTLDGFLSRLDKDSSAKLFELFGRLERGVEDARLPEILEKLQNGEKKGFFEKLFGQLSGKRADEIAREFMESIGALISGRTKTLADEMSRLEGDLTGEMQKLFGELQALDALKRSYAGHFSEFTVAAGMARALLERSKAYVAQQEAALNPLDVTAQAKLTELKDKLRLLESRALALEGTYTRLPADQMVIQQIEQAGVATLQETATTLASRFASIKMTLLSIHGAFAVKSVQQIASRQAKLDEQLTELRGRALKDVAVTAATAPGDNRLAQAQQIENIIATTKEIHGLVAEAKRSTDAKFEQARQKFSAAREELATLASQ